MSSSPVAIRTCESPLTGSVLSSFSSSRWICSSLRFSCFAAVAGTGSRPCSGSVTVSCSSTNALKKEGCSGQGHLMRSGNPRYSSTADSWRGCPLNSLGPCKILRRKRFCKTAETLHKH